MNELKLNEYLDEYGKFHSPEPSRALIESIMRIPHEAEEMVEMDLTLGISWKIRDWCMFLVPRLSGLTAMCVLGIYMGGVGSTALAEDEIALYDEPEFLNMDTGELLEEEGDVLLDIEEFIIVEEPVE